MEPACSLASHAMRFTLGNHQTPPLSSGMRPNPTRFSNSLPLSQRTIHSPTSASRSGSAIPSSSPDKHSAVSAPNRIAAWRRSNSRSCSKPCRIPSARPWRRCERNSGSSSGPESVPELQPSVVSLDLATGKMHGLAAGKLQSRRQRVVHRVDLRDGLQWFRMGHGEIVHNAQEGTTTITASMAARRVCGPVEKWARCPDAGTEPGRRDPASRARLRSPRRAVPSVGKRYLRRIQTRHG